MQVVQAVLEWKDQIFLYFCGTRVADDSTLSFGVYRRGLWSNGDNEICKFALFRL